MPARASKAISAYRSWRRLWIVTALTPVLGWSQPPAELLDLRREVDREGVRLVAQSSTRSPLRFDYSSPSLEEIVLVLHDVAPGSLAGASGAWSPEVAAVEVAAQLDSAGRLATRLTIRLAEFRRYRIRTEGDRLLIVLLREAEDGIPSESGEGRESVEAEPESTPVLEPRRPPRVAPVSTPLPDSPDEAPTVAPDGPRATRVLDLSYRRDAGSLTVRVETDGAPTHRVFELQGPDRLVLDLIGMVADPASRRIEIGEAGISRARLAQHRVDPERVVRVVVDMETPMLHRLVVGDRSLSVVFLTR